MLQKIFGLFFIVTCSLCILFTNCNNTTKTTISNTDTIPTMDAKEIGIVGNFSSQKNIKFDSADIKLFLDSFPKFKVFEKDIVLFYNNREYAYAWFDEKGMIEPATNLFNRIQNISEEGLPDALPYKTAFTNFMEAEDGSLSLSPTVELMLTAQYLAYGKNVWEGLSEKQTMSIEWLLPRKKITSAQLLDSLVSGKNILDNSPVFKQYNLLKGYLKKYSLLKTTGNLKPIFFSKKKYTLNDSSSDVAAIRECLFMLGDLDKNNQSGVFDETLQNGVKQFQHRLGYKEDGIVNSTVIAEINLPLDKRIEQIIVNMERSRWVPVALTSDYLLINIPEYKLHAYEKDSLVFDMNVVVGKNQHKTVIFNGIMKNVVFSPYWNIPASILKNETLPAIKKNPNYLAKHNMEWNGGNVRQKPGPNNSLGLVKFLFPNTHSIYLHDTPAKSLFNEDNRAFSHGCIRLAEPKKLAQYLLRNDPAWNLEKITAAMNRKVEQYVILKQPIPVFIAYFTAWVDKNGKLNFRNDIYNRDSRLAKMILEKPAI